MIDICLPGEQGSGQGNAPAIPEDIEVAIWNNDASPTYICRFREGMLCRWATAGEQSILVALILLQHCRDKVANISANARSLSNCCRIIYCDTHKTTFIDVAVLLKNKRRGYLSSLLYG